MSQEAYNQGADQAAQDPTILSRIGSLADTAIDTIKDTYHGYRNKALAVFTASVALAGVASLESPTLSEAATSPVGVAETATIAGKNITPLNVVLTIGNFAAASYQGYLGDLQYYTNESIRPFRLTTNARCPQVVGPNSVFLKSIDDLRKKMVVTSCVKNADGQFESFTLLRSSMPYTFERHINFTQDIIKLGNRVAETAHLTTKQTGHADYIYSTKKQSDVFYKGHKGQVKEIILRAHKKPEERWYK